MTDTLRFRFDEEKAVEVIVYIATRAPRPDIYWVLKILFFADKLHLERFGALICGDSYVAMKNGPVPSGTYDIVKDVREDRVSFLYQHPRNRFAVDGNRIIPLKDADLDQLSESELECLDEAIHDYGKLSFDTLKRLSHEDRAFKAADENDSIPTEEIIAGLPSGRKLLEYLYDAD